MGHNIFVQQQQTIEEKQARTTICLKLFACINFAPNSLFVIGHYLL